MVVHLPRCGDPFASCFSVCSQNSSSRSSNTRLNQTKKATATLVTTTCGQSKADQRFGPSYDLSHLRKTGMTTPRLWSIIGLVPFLERCSFNWLVVKIPRCRDEETREAGISILKKHGNSSSPSRWPASSWVICVRIMFVRHLRVGIHITTPVSG